MKAKLQRIPQPQEPTKYPDTTISAELVMHISDSLWPLRDEAAGLRELIGILNAEKSSNPIFHSLLPLAVSLQDRVETLGGYLDEALLKSQSNMEGGGK